MKKYLILAVLAILIVLISSAVPIRGGLWFSQYLFLLYFVYFLPVIFLWKFNRFLSIFIGVAWFSTITISQFSPRAVVLLTQFESMALISYGISKFNSKYRRFLCYSFLIVFLIESVMMVLQWFHFDPIFRNLNPSLNHNVVGFMGSSGQFGMLQAVLSPIVTYFSILFIPIILLSVMVSKSLFAMIACLVSIGIFISFKIKNILKVLIIVNIIFILFYLIKVDSITNAAVEVRKYVWTAAASSTLNGNIEINKGSKIQTIKCNPLFGYGFGNFLTIFPYVDGKGKFNYVNEKFTHAHNDFIEHGLFETGLIGMIALILLVAMFLLGFFFSQKSTELAVYFSSIIAYLICSSGYFLSQIAVTGFYFAIIYGMYEGARRELNG